MTKNVFDKGFDKENLLGILQEQMVKKDKALDEHLDGLLKCYKTLMKVWNEICQKYDLETLKKVWEDVCGFQSYDEDETEVRFLLDDYLRYHYGWDSLINADVYLKYGDKNLYVDFEEFDEPKSVMDIAELKYQLDHLDELVESLTSHLGTLIENLPDVKKAKIQVKDEKNNNEETENEFLVVKSL